MLTHQYKADLKYVGDRLEDIETCLNEALNIIAVMTDRAKALQLRVNNLEARHEALKARLDKVYR